MSGAPIRVGHPDAGVTTSPCGCCDGTALATLQPTENRPNLSAIAFRAGDHASFKATMLTNLASAAHPALAELRTREDDDFSIALIDAWASVCDVLTFYQERLANEAYMGTATERLSVGELARLIGYRLHPGAAAETDLVILMEDPPGAAPDVSDLLVPAGTHVQSQPGPDESPQVFETLADLDARVAWNTLRPRLTRPILPGNGDNSAWAEGTPALQVGDAIVFISRERSDQDFFGFDVNSTLWDFRFITSVETAADGQRTRITWNTALDSVATAGNQPTPGLTLYQLRERASLFGHNAPHPRVLSEEIRESFGFISDELPIIEPGEPIPEPSPSVIRGIPEHPGDWHFTLAAGTGITLDTVYKPFVPHSWALLSLRSGLEELYRIEDAKADTEARYAIGGRTTRLTLDKSGQISSFAEQYRRVAVYGGSQEIPLAETPLDTWVAGDKIELDQAMDDLPEGRKLILRGLRAQLRVTAQVVGLTADDGAIRGVTRGAIVTLMDDPVPQGAALRFHLRDETGFIGTAVEPPTALEPVAAPEDSEEIALAATLERIVAVDASHSRLELAEPLGAAFDRTSLRIHANVVRAAHGEAAAEILGSGNPSSPYQKFQLKQAPVTHRLAPTETGVESTLQLRIDGVEWREVPDLYQRGAAARVYKTSLTDEGKTVIEFGDGISGARPPAGRDNIVVEHSRGLGRDGNLRAGQLTLPLDRPLGLKATDNPLPAAGGADPEATEEARINASLFTLTLGRVVSLTDYRDFALSFPGIARAEARWVWQGETRRILVTIAGEGGATIAPRSATFSNLLDALRNLGDPLVGVDLLSYQPASFRVGLKVAVDSAYDSETVLAATEQRLRRAFSFASRGFGEVLSLSEVAAAAHKVEGLRAVDIDRLYRTSSPQTLPIAHARLLSLGARLGADGTLLPAEILTLAPGPLDKLELMA
ncbi:baseplate J/gp47 family protein [Billgrantia montanilacus]|uniref:Uncharacterized protein n=1 Tax=Billgrantia montanilacus TaxID=2282305 RepID=A0A368TWE7_9GAMM|nr:baseplate J/gp47 family protein [Halomonas montanilacus]RCV89149.1 hypothetical protein DU505_11370 [Halomonas montanilacus]